MPDQVRGTNDPNANAMNYMPGRVDMDEETRILGNPEVAYLKSIDATLRDMAQGGLKVSQSAARQAMPRRSEFRDRQSQSWANKQFGFDKKHKYSGGRDPMGDVLDGMGQAIFDAMGGSAIKKRMRGILDNVAATFGADLEDVPGIVGEELGKKAVSLFKGTEFGRSASGKLDKYINSILGDIDNAFQIKKAKDTSYADGWTSDFKKKNQVEQAQQATKRSLSNAEDFGNMQSSTFNIQSAVINIQSAEYQKELAEQDAEEEVSRANQQAEQAQSRVEDSFRDDSTSDVM